MRHALALTATVIALAWAVPASAQMCGGGPSHGLDRQRDRQGGGMMCGMRVPGSASRDRPDD